MTDVNNALIINDETQDTSRPIQSGQEAVNGDNNAIPVVIRQTRVPTGSDIYPTGNIWINTSTNDSWFSVGSGIWKKSSLAVGQIALNTTNSVYTVSHSNITALSQPLCSLVLPVSGSEIFMISIFGVTTGSFGIETTSIPSISGYKINWSA